MTAVEHVPAARSVLGEGPLWSPDEQALYWVDIDRHLVHRYDPATGGHESFDVGLPVGALGLRASGGLVMATLKGFAFWDPETEEITFIADPEADKGDTRFNDGAVDRKGRFWAGTIALDPDEYALPKGTLYRLDPDGSVHTMVTQLTISNGIGWSPDDATMYLTDTMRQVIYAYDYDLETGDIENRRVFVDSRGEEGYPDGLAVDSQGFVWSARFGGGRVYRYHPGGMIERVIELTVACPTSCAFGGPQLDELYITTSQHTLSEEEKKSQPLAGELFRLGAGVKGIEEARFAG